MVEFLTQFLVSKRLQARFDSPNVFQVLLLDLSEFINYKRIIEIDVELSRHLFHFLGWPRKVKVHHVVQVFFGVAGLFYFLFQFFSFFNASSFLQQPIVLFTLLDHLLQIVYFFEVLFVF